VILKRALFDIWVRVIMSDGDIIDLESPSELQVIKDKIVDPVFIEKHGHKTIKTCKIMSDICIGIS
jgi:hypothetical protein